LNPTPPPVETVVEEQNREDRAEVEEIANPSPRPPPAELRTFIKRDILFQVDKDDIIEAFMSLRKRRINK